MLKNLKLPETTDKYAILFEHPVNERLSTLYEFFDPLGANVPKLEDYNHTNPKDFVK